jgi:xanthine dehydrogenase YagR molybdenum-binding subunit
VSIPAIGAPYDRIEGSAKVTGEALYTGDVAIAGMLHAVVVPSTVGSGTIVSIDETRTRAHPGVVEVMTNRNAPRVNTKKTTPNDSLLFLLQDDVVQFDRQPVAVVIARTFEQAVYGADLLAVRYDAEAPQTNLDRAAKFVPQQIDDQPANRTRGNPSWAFRAAPAAIKRTYRTPAEHHNPMEPHATIAEWKGNNLELHDSTQWAFGVQRRLAAVFGIPAHQIHVIVPFVGGAFGGKGQTWSHVALAAMAAKLVRKPVKLILTRPQLFGWVGHRPQTEQTISLGADRNGHLQAVLHDVRSETSMSDEFVEPCGVFSRDLYAVPNFEMSHELRRLNISKPTFQRAPGESTGSFALESAMDELAYELRMDPLELRLRNYSQNNPDSGKPYTSKRLRECYRLAAEAFGWSRRNPYVRSMRRGRVLVGVGMATASRQVGRSRASARIRMNSDGSVIVSSGTIEQGTGSPTVYAQLASEILGVRFELVEFEFGDTTLPYAPVAAGSQTAMSVGAAVALAAQQLRQRLDAAGGHPPPQGLEVSVDAKPDENVEAKYASQSFGAHFAEVEIDPDVSTVHVTRFTSAFDGGRILNAKTARSQFLGGIVWGISMALFEKARFDDRTARIMNATLAEYLVPTNADIPNVEILMVQGDDPQNPAHVKGIGEVATTGSAAAVANAVFHATGVRIRELPITPDKLLV